MKKNAFFFIILFAQWHLSAQSCIQGVINSYTPVLSFECSNNAIIVSDATSFSAGNLILIMQMKGGEVDLSNSSSSGNLIDLGVAGNYEFNRISQIQGNQIYLQYALTQQYNTDQAVQLIKVPEYQNITSCALTCPSWDGVTGGVLTLKVTGTLTMQGNMDVSAKGYRGGTHVNCQTTSNHETNYVFETPDPNKASAKGESIYSLPPMMSYGRGRMVTGGGGGNAHNAGGGGGGNGGSGGRGGKEFSHTIPDPNTFGFEGSAMPPHPAKIFMGGGGGAGHTNDFTGTSGGAGGGIVILIADNIIANGHKVVSNGGNVLGGNSNNDGQGGGGAGGTIAIYAPGVSTNISLEALGGRGGNSIFLTAPGQKIGPGGGGGGGIAYLYHTTPAVSVALQGGIRGVTNQSDPYGAESGALGIMVTNQYLPWDTLAPDQAISYTITPAECDDPQSGAIQVNTPAANYLLGGITSTTGLFTGLSAGTYPLTLLYNPNCTITDTVEIMSSGYVMVEHLYFLCPNESVVVNQQTWQAPSIFFDTTFTTNGCDTITQHIFIAKPLPTLSRSFDFCPGDTLWVNGMGFSVPATLIDTIPGENTCDTVRTTYIKWTELPEYEQTIWVCSGEKVLIDGMWYSSGSLVRDTLHFTETCDTVKIWVVKDFPHTLPHFLPDTAIYCPGDLLQWCSPWPNTQWNGSTLSACYQATDVGTVIAFATDTNGCPVRDTVFVTYCCGPTTIYAPNSFAPGQASPNDRFSVFTKADCDTYLLRVFDRWGALLFESHSPAQSWDGTFRGKDCSAGVYLWVLETGQKGQSLPAVLKGNVTLLR